MQGGPSAGSSFEQISMQRLTGGPIVKRGLYGVGGVSMGGNLERGEVHTIDLVIA